jgi:hypothetical protein
MVDISGHINEQFLDNGEHSTHFAKCTALHWQKLNIDMPNVVMTRRRT